MPGREIREDQSDACATGRGPVGRAERRVSLARLLRGKELCSFETAHGNRSSPCHTRREGFANQVTGEAGPRSSQGGRKEGILTAMKVPPAEA